MTKLRQRFAFESFSVVALLLFVTTVFLVVAVSVVAAEESDVSSSSSSQGQDTDTEYLNVYGQPLQPCSYDGMALTGYTRSGYCVDRWNDQGSHHVCIDLSSTSTGSSDDDNNNNGQNFCQVTGQSDWCSSEDMPCHEYEQDQDADDQQEQEQQYGCPVTNWCVCQWAFSSYVKASSEGCDNIQSVVCESINVEALLAYQRESSKWNADPKYQTALECLVNRCGLDINNLPGGNNNSLFSISSIKSKMTKATPGSWIAFFVLSIAAAVGVGTIYHRRRVSKLKTIHVNENDGIIVDTPANNTGSHLLQDEK